MKIFSGNSNKCFAEQICKKLDIKLGDAKIDRFIDGECHIIINENVRHENCFIIQSTCSNKDLGISVNDSIIELIIMIDALRRGSAKYVNVVIPYYGYSRQDRKDYSRAPISAAAIANCLESQNIDRVIVFDLHAGQIAGFFSNKCPLDNLYFESYLLSYISQKILVNNITINDIIIVAPDEGAVKSAHRISNKLQCGMATIFKSRINPNEIDTMKLMGEVNGKIAIMVDDIIDTGGTVCKGATMLVENGATDVYMLACHGLFSGNALEKITNSTIKKIIVSNTIPHNKEIVTHRKIDIIDISQMCAEAIRRQHYGESLKQLYDFNFQGYSIELI